MKIEIEVLGIVAGEPNWHKRFKDVPDAVMKSYRLPNGDDPKWLERRINKLRLVANQKEKAKQHKIDQK